MKYISIYISEALFSEYKEYVNVNKLFFNICFFSFREKQLARQRELIEYYFGCDACYGWELFALLIQPTETILRTALYI